MKEYKESTQYILDYMTYWSPNEAIEILKKSWSFFDKKYLKAILIELTENPETDYLEFDKLKSMIDV